MMKGSFYPVSHKACFPFTGKRAFFVSIFSVKRSIYTIWLREFMKMKKYVGLLLTVLLSVFALVACGEEAAKNQSTEKVEETKGETSDYPRTFTDGRGVEVTLEEKPTRIVSTTLAIDEYLLS